MQQDTQASATIGSPEGKIPYGYRRMWDAYTRKFLAVFIIEREADIIRRIFSLRGLGWTLDRIVQAIQDTPSPRNKYWTATAVWRIIKNEDKYRGQDGWPRILP